MFNFLHFENFKSWRSADVRFGQITGLFGTNSSGKTSILQFLLLLKQTKDTTDRATALELGGEDQLLDLGTYRDAIHLHEVDRNICWNLEWGTGATSSLRLLDEPAQTRLIRASQFGISAEVRGNRGPISTRKLSYYFGDARFELALRNDDKSEFALNSEGISWFKFIRTVGRPWQLPSPIKSYAFPDQARTYYQNASFLSELELAYEKQMDSIFYLGPLREHPKRDYYWSKSRPSDVGSNGKRAIEAILAATEAGTRLNLKYKGPTKPFQEIIAHWLRHMGLIHDFHVSEIAKNSNRWIAHVVTRPGSADVPLTDVGFGVSQVLPVITLLYYVPEGSTVILEQPEIHLHPLAQAALADVLINAATHRKVQIVLESHSEHLLLRLQRRIAEEAIKTSDIRLYFCDSGKNGSNLEPLQMDIFGQITNWPPRFMGDAFEETFKAEQARLKRMQAAE